MLIEKIPIEELNMIDAYRRDFSPYHDASHICEESYADIHYILREWDIQKSEHLYNLFEENLILTKEIAYEKPEDELETEISNFCTYTYGRIGRRGDEFYTAFINLASNFSSLEIKDGLLELIGNQSLIDNKYSGCSFNLPFPREDKVYKVITGCKTSKTLGKIASIYNLPGYEDFRICHSQVLNQKTLHGNLSISIHPFDYMTMSDNDCDWDSCMSWRNEGSYRQGTVEMMNSKSVIVAYLSAESDMPIYTPNGKRYWNNKKWRNLFIVEKDFITSIKDYPYENEELTRTVLEWLRELAGKNLGWFYEEPIRYHYNSRGIHINYPDFPEDKNNFDFDMSSGAMYNDFGCINYHHICVNPGIDPEVINIGNRWTKKKYYEYFYSGRMECVVCGELDPDLCDDGALACTSCQERIYCDCCGEPIQGEVLEVDGYTLCFYCYQNRAINCYYCGQEHLEDKMALINIIPRLTKEDEESVRKYYFVENKSWLPFCIEDLEKYTFVPNGGIPKVWTCNEKEPCFDKWVKENLIKGHYPHIRSPYNGFYVYYDELTDEAKDEYAFGYENEEEFKSIWFRLKDMTPTKVIDP